MKPIDLENEILLALKRAGGKGLTVASVHKRVSPAGSEGPSWREVASSVTRLSRMGWVYVSGEAQHGEDMHPMFALTSAGEHAACAARIQQHNAARAGTTRETDNANS